MKKMKKLLSGILAIALMLTSLVIVPPAEVKAAAPAAQDGPFIVKNSAEEVPNITRATWGNDLNSGGNHYPYYDKGWHNAFDNDESTKAIINPMAPGEGIYDSKHHEGDYVIFNFETSFMLKELKIVSNGNNAMENYEITAANGDNNFDIPITSAQGNNSLTIKKENLNVEISALKIRVTKEASRKCWWEFNEIYINYKVIIDNTTKNMTYFPSTMFKYDSVNFNKATEELVGTDIASGMYFTNNVGENAVYRQELWNQWTPARDKTSYTGLVNSSLVDGKIQFTKPQAGIFDATTENKTIYHNVEVPFEIGNDGYYTLDSNIYDANFLNGTPNDNTRMEFDFNKKEYRKSNYTESAKFMTKGFYPYNSVADEFAQYHFGMNLGVDFYMTRDGQQNGQDIQFEFSGDDDVWVFVDGKLVLDIGGIHGRIQGTINFATGVVYKDGL